MMAKEARAVKVKSGGVAFMQVQGPRAQDDSSFRGPVEGGAAGDAGNVLLPVPAGRWGATPGALAFAFVHSLTGRL